MTEKPSVETHYVGTMVAFATMRSLAINLATYLADAPDAIRQARELRQPEPDYAHLVRTLMETSLAATEDTDITDLRPDQYDRDQALEIALDTVAEAFELVRKAALHE